LNRLLRQGSGLLGNFDDGQGSPTFVEMFRGLKAFDAPGVEFQSAEILRGRAAR
jgi:hypothetical protein